MIYKLNDTKKKGFVYTIILLRYKVLAFFIIHYLLIVDHGAPSRLHALPMSIIVKETYLNNKKKKICV